MNDNELMNRRRFFKKTAGEMLPMLGAFVAAPTVIMSTLSSCGPDDCDGCEAECKDNCVDNCKGSCSDACSSSSAGGGCSDCSTSCSGSSTSNTCTSCANDCSSSCKETCQNTCENACSTSCEGSATGKPTTGTINGHEYMDLGLSVLWATCNLGASKRQNFGDYFAFADTNEKVTGETGDKAYYDGLGLKGGDNISGTKNDIAKRKWGSGWRLPTKDELEELVNNCCYEYAYYLDDVKHDGIEYSFGLTFINKKNDQQIFLPFAGCKFYKGDNDDAYANNDAGLYMSGNVITSLTLDKINLRQVNLHIGSKAGSIDPFVDMDDSNLNTFVSIRPVIDRSYGDVLTCNGTCTANCSSDCSSTCKNSCGNNCTGGCKTTCTKTCADSCSNDCTGKCTRTCADSCSSNCSSGCTTTCADACKAQTSQYCSNCASNCSSGCTTTCADACKAQTSQGCSNCAIQCSGECNRECTYGCGRQCHTSCGGQCKGKCGGSCQFECVSYAKNTPCASCGGTCRSACNENCTYDCYSTCKSVGYK